MDSALIQILIVDNELAYAQAIRCSFEDAGMKVNIQIASTIAEYRRLKELCMPDIAIIDLNLQDGRSLELLASPPEAGPFPILMMTSQSDAQMAVEAVKAGALDYVVKSPETFTQMPHILVRALREWRLLTERRNAQEALRVNEKRYRHLFKNMLEGYALCKILFVEGRPEDFIYVEVNESFERLTGLSKVVGKKVSEVVPGVMESDPDMLEIYSRVALSGSPAHFETFRVALGIWLSVSVYSPEKEYFVAFLDNITERKKTEVALRESEERFRQIAEQLSDVLFVTDTKGLITYISPASTRLFGWPPEEMIGRSYTDFLTVNEIPGAQTAFHQVITTGQDARELALVMLRKDGSTFYGELNGSLLHIQEQTVGTLVVIRDVTDRMRAEEAVRKSEDLLNRTQRMSRLGGWEYDVGKKTISWTDEVYRIHEISHDYDSNDIKQDLSFYSGEDRAVMEQAFWNAVNDGTAYDLELRFTTAKGKSLWVRTVGECERQDGMTVRVFGSIIDITERKQSEDALHKSEKKYRDLVELSHDLIWAVDVDGRITYISPACLRILGHAPGEMTGRIFTDYFPHEEGHRNRTEFERALTTGEPSLSYESRMYHRDGHEVILLTNASVLRDEVGNIIGAAGTSQDITAQKKAEIALRESENRFRHYFELGLIGIAITSPTKGWIEANDEICRILGYERTELLRMHWADLTHPDDLAADIANFNRVLAGEINGYSMEKRFIRKDGRIIQGIISVKCSRRPDGSVDYFVAMLVDITERKLSEQILIAQRTELAAIYENAPFIMLLIDKDRRIRKVNKTGATFTDSLAADMIGMRGGEALRCLHALNDPQGCGYGTECEQCILRQTIQDTFVTGTDHNLVEATMHFNVKGKELEAALLLSTTRLVLGLQAMVLVTMMDVTDRKRIEQEVKLAQTRLMQANKMSSLGMLVSSVAHEVNNPNNFIMFNSSLLSGAWKDIAPVLDRYADKEPAYRVACLPYADMREAIPKLLAGITDGSRRIKDMVDRLREISREDRSGLDGAIDVNSAVRSAVMILQNQIMKYSDNFALELDEALPPVRGSAQQLEQVVINLIQNALQSLHDRKGWITVKTAPDNAKHQVVIEVRDSGHGISAQNLKRIAEPFFTTKLDSGGTGLGLSISSSIIRDHQGALHFQSEEGKGTTARVILPIEKANMICHSA
jgi:PAS domain S-box-containing protein